MSRLSWPAFLARGYWTAKRLALLVGFLLTVIGSLGTQFLVSPYDNLSSILDLRAKDLSAKIDVLKSAQAQYILFQQQGALIFAISMAGISAGTPEGPKMISQLFQLNMLDRMEAVQTIIGSLALGHVLDYRSTFDHYKQLVDAARADISLANYTAVDDAEKSLSKQATSQLGALQDNLLKLQQMKGQSDSSGSRNRLILLVAMTLGSSFLLIANLISTREAKTESPTAPTATDDRFTELTTAAYLIEVALEQARGLSDKKASG